MVEEKLTGGPGDLVPTTISLRRYQWDWILDRFGRSVSKSGAMRIIISRLMMEEQKAADDEKQAAN